jgi:hypothetical protein
VFTRDETDRSKESIWLALAPPVHRSKHAANRIKPTLLVVQFGNPTQALIEVDPEVAGAGRYVLT